MLLTLAKPVKSEFEFKTHDYSPNSSSAATRYSPKSINGYLPSQRASATTTMGTPHRGLPPPSAMTLPDPGRGPSIASSLGAMPPAPSQWQGAEDGMKNWLAAKAEEEKRRQEEEKTKQHSLKVEQRRIEQTMLRESMQGGIPLHLVPMIFAGIGGGSPASMSAEWIQQYQSQLQAAQQQQPAQVQSHSMHSPEARRETRMIGQTQPGAYASQPQTPQTVLPPTSVLPGQPLPSQPAHAPFATGPYGSDRPVQPGHGGAPTSAPRPPQSQLPRLTTNEMHIQQPPAGPPNVQQLQQNQPAQQESQASPSIYFHHWVPPTSQQDKAPSGNPPATPSGKYKTSPKSFTRHRATSHASDPDYISSPKKRKAQGGHQPPPIPSSAPQSYTSPSFSHVSTSSASTPGRRGHARARSDVSSRGAEGHGGSLSRRGTVSSQAHTETGPPHSEISEHRFQRPPRAPEDYRHHQQHESPYASRDEGRIGPQTTTAMAIPSETRQSAQHQHLDRGPAPSPKWETGPQ